MTAMLRLVALNGVALLGFCALVSAAAALAHRAVARRARLLPPSLRVRRLLAWAARRGDVPARPLGPARGRRRAPPPSLDGVAPRPLPH